MLNAQILVLILALLLIIASYQIFEKENLINEIKEELEEVKNKYEYAEKQRNSILKQLDEFNSEVQKYQHKIFELNKNLSAAKEKIDELNNSLIEINNKYEQLLNDYKILNETLGTREEIKDLIKEINYRLNWVEGNYKAESNKYINLKNDVYKYCFNNSVLDIACSYLLARKFMNYTDIDALDINTALENNVGDCLTFSILIDRLIKEINPKQIRFLKEDTGKSYQINIGSNIIIRNARPIEISYNITEVVCYYNKRLDKGHCALRINNIIVDEYYQIGEIDKDLKFCKDKSCEWKSGYITMVINNKDILYLGLSLRDLIKKI